MHSVGTDDSLSEATAAPCSPVGELAVVLEASLLLALSTHSLPLKLHGMHLREQAVPQIRRQHQSHIKQTTTPSMKTFVKTG